MKNTALVVAGFVAAGLLAYTSSSSARPGWVVERYYTTENWSSFADIGKKGAGAGDVYTSQQSLRSLDERPVGVVNGFGVNLHKPYVFFHWTASLSTGTLTIESAINLMNNSATYPISGGTGRYAGARGTVTITDAGKNRSLATVRYQR